MLTPKSSEEKIIRQYLEDKGHYVQFDVIPIFETLQQYGMAFEEFYEGMDGAIQHINLHLIAKDTDITRETENMFYSLYAIRNMFKKMQVQN